MAANVAAKQTSEHTDISGMVCAAIQSKIPQGGVVPPVLLAKVQDLADTFDQMQRQHEESVATPEATTPVEQHSAEEEEAMVFVGFGSGDKHNLDEVAEIMEENKDGMAAKRLRAATETTGKASGSQPHL